MTKRIILFLMPICSAAGLAACGSSSDSTTSEKDEVGRAMQAALATDIKSLLQAATDLAAAAPTPQGRGWDKRDAEAVVAMKTAWVNARAAYEHVEGALAPIFPDIDVSIDERYDGFISGPATQGDQNLFDDQGVTGMHAIERIL